MAERGSGGRRASEVKSEPWVVRKGDGGRIHGGVSQKECFKEKRGVWTGGADL